MSPGGIDLSTERLVVSMARVDSSAPSTAAANRGRVADQDHHARSEHAMSIRAGINTVRDQWDYVYSEQTQAKLAQI
ncbi:MAG: hypothetical protein ACOCYX_06065, partial [Spirochaetota bacterium]